MSESSLSRTRLRLVVKGGRVRVEKLGGMKINIVGVLRWRRRVDENIRPFGNGFIWANKTIVIQRFGDHLGTEACWFN